MDYNEIYNRLPRALLPWYRSSHRDLPWRLSKDPYHIWVSEIMLQQTRVEAVKGYYSRFLEKLPTIEDLANADDELLHKLWEGLGYYNRANNLKKAAEVIMEKLGGQFPQNYEEVLSLPGIGAYTAGAICSIAFDSPTPAVDGNVLRVISRLTNDDTCVDDESYKNAVRAKLARIYPDAAGDFTQALMELGATVCGPNRKPECEACPCKDFCLGLRAGAAQQLPVRKQKKARREEEKTVFILSCNGEYAIEKRDKKGLLAGLWQFPNTAGKMELNGALDTLREWGFTARDIYQTIERKHIFTHIQWNMTGIYVEVNQKTERFTWMTAAQIEAEAALPTAFRQFWEIRPTI